MNTALSPRNPYLALSSRGPKDRGTPRVARPERRRRWGVPRDDSGEARLVLFDVDGTLLSAGSAARESILAALSAVLGWGGSADGNDFSGKTDPQILRELVLESVGAERFEAALSDVLNRYVEELRRRLRPEAVVPKPGIPALLERLAAEPRVTLGLLTGNIERGARMKLEPPGFNRYFPFGAFGDDSPDRYCLPPIALARARETTGKDFAPGAVVIVGDSIHDVACGRSLGARAIAVSTGPTPAEKLAAERPHALFSDFSDVESAAEAILR